MVSLDSDHFPIIILNQIEIENSRDDRVRWNVNKADWFFFVKTVSEQQISNYEDFIHKINGASELAISVKEKTIIPEYN